MFENDCFIYDADTKKVAIKDFTKFDVAIEEYLHGTLEVPEKVYERIYTEIAEMCNESNEYMIDCWKGRYTVRRIDELSQIHYESLTEEEKEVFDRDKKIEEIRNEMYSCQRKLSDSDYVANKLVEVSDDPQAFAVMKEEYKDVLIERQSLRDKINECRKKLEELGYEETSNES